MSTQDARLLSYLGHQIHILDYFHISAVVILLYDNILTFHDEISLIWSSRWSGAKILFLSTRYIPYLPSMLLLFNQLPSGRTEKTCKITWNAASWMMIVTVNVAETILAVRTWAIWRRNRLVGVFLAMLLLVCLSLEIYYTNDFLNGLEFLQAPYPSFRGCYVYDTKKNLYASLIPLIVEEIVILMLVVICAYPSYKPQEYNELTQVVYRDGVIFYIYILMFSVLNIILMKLLSSDLSSIMIPMEISIYSVLSARIILNIREASSTNFRVGETELRSMQLTDSLRFVGASGYDNDEED